MNKRAEDKLSARTSKVPNWYLDLSLLNRYWGSDRVYHHTAPVNMNFAIREGLRLIANEGLENIWRRHNSNALKLWKGLESLGMELHVSSEFRGLRLIANEGLENIWRRHNLMQSNYGRD